MKVTLMQRDIVWANPTENRQRAEQALLAEPGSDLYVLPEMWNTGFATKPTGIAESADGETLRWMRGMAARLDAAIAGSVAIRETDGSYRNRLYFVKPSGDISFYDKHHLFSFGVENEHYTSGCERTVVEWRGVRFLLMVCYDLRFPIWSRNRDDYDAIIYVASWPSQRMTAWRILLRARAIENQCYVLGVNRVGRDPQCEYVGGTALIDPYGRDEECPEKEETTLSGTIDMTFLHNYQERFPQLKERD